MAGEEKKLGQAAPLLQAAAWAGCVSMRARHGRRGGGSVLTLGPDSNLINARARGHWTLGTAPCPPLAADMRISVIVLPTT